MKTPACELACSRRETWAFALGKFFIDPIWWFYLFWLPSCAGQGNMAST